MRVAFTWQVEMCLAGTASLKVRMCYHMKNDGGKKNTQKVLNFSGRMSCSQQERAAGVPVGFLRPFAARLERTE